MSVGLITHIDNPSVADCRGPRPGCRVGRR